MQGSFSNRQHVLSAVDKIKEKMSKKDDWKMRYQALEELEKLVKQGSEEDGFASIFDSLSLEFKYILPKQLIDLRSEILRQACQTISTMAECLQEHMRKLGNEIMPNLLLAATTVNRVIRQYAITCCHNLIANVTGKNMLMPIITTLRETKSKQMRPIMMELLEACLANWPTKSLTKRVVEIENTISFGLECPTAETRDAAARSFFLFLQHFPKKEKSVVARLPSRAQRIVERMRGTQTPTAKKASPGKYGSTVRRPNTASRPRTPSGRSTARHLSYTSTSSRRTTSRPMSSHRPGSSQRPRTATHKSTPTKSRSSRLSRTSTHKRSMSSSPMEDEEPRSTKTTPRKRGSHNSDNSSVRSSLARAKTHISRSPKGKRSSMSPPQSPKGLGMAFSLTFDQAPTDTPNSRRTTDVKGSSDRDPSPEWFDRTLKSRSMDDMRKIASNARHSIEEPETPPSTTSRDTRMRDVSPSFIENESHDDDSIPRPPGARRRQQSKSIVSTTSVRSDDSATVHTGYAHHIPLPPTARKESPKKGDAESVTSSASGNSGTPNRGPMNSRVRRPMINPVASPRGRVTRPDSPSRIPRAASPARRAESPSRIPRPPSRGRPSSPRRVASPRPSSRSAGRPSSRAKKANSRPGSSSRVPSRKGPPKIITPTKPGSRGSSRGSASSPRTKLVTRFPTKNGRTRLAQVREDVETVDGAEVLVIEQVDAEGRESETARTPSVTKSSRRASDKQKSKSATHAERKRNSKDKRAFGFSRDDVHSNRRESHASAQTDASNRSPSPELFSESGKNSEEKAGAGSVSQTFQDGSMSAAGGEKSHASQGLPMYLLLINRYQKSIMDTYNMFKRDEIGEEAFAEQVLDILYEQSEKTQSQTAKMRKVLKAARKSRESGSSSESKRHSRTRSDGVGHHISHRMREEAKAEAIKNELPEEY